MGNVTSKFSFSRAGRSKKTEGAPRPTFQSVEDGGNINVRVEKFQIISRPLNTTLRQPLLAQ